MCVNKSRSFARWNQSLRRSPNSNRALLRLNSTWAIQQTARNCAEQFSILSPGEKCQSKKGVVEILSLRIDTALILTRMTYKAGLLLVTALLFVGCTTTEFESWEGRNSV